MAEAVRDAYRRMPVALRLALIKKTSRDGIPGLRKVLRLAGMTKGFQAERAERWLNESSLKRIEAVLLQPENLPALFLFANELKRPPTAGFEELVTAAEAWGRSGGESAACAEPGSFLEEKLAALDAALAPVADWLAAAREVRRSDDAEEIVNRVAEANALAGELHEELHAMAAGLGEDAPAPSSREELIACWDRL